MSLVGIRPSTLDEWEKYKYYYRARLTIQPGITELWQVSNHSKITDFEVVMCLNTQHINNWSRGLDFKILLKTLVVVLRGEGSK